jgi:hypothetical protein
MLLRGAATGLGRRFDRTEAGHPASVISARLGYEYPAGEGLFRGLMRITVGDKANGERDIAHAGACVSHAREGVRLLRNYREPFGRGAPRRATPTYRQAFCLA